MRTLAIGDIHGFLDAFEAILAVASPGPDDLLVTLGDYVDRGPDSAGVLERLVELHAGGRLVALCGNHDEMMLRSRHDRDVRRSWLHWGGIETLASYGHKPRDDDYYRVPEHHWEFLEHDCRDWYESETHLFAHANIDPRLPMDQQDSMTLLWQRLHMETVHYSGKRFICGHTRQTSGLPLELGPAAVCIDTGIYARAVG